MWLGLISGSVSSPIKSISTAFERRRPLIAVLLAPCRPVLANVGFGAVLKGGPGDLGFADLDIRQHRRPHDTRLGRHDTRFRTRILSGLDGHHRDWMGTILTRKPLCCKRFGASWERLGSLAGGESGIRTHGTVSRTHAFQACALSHSAISPEGLSGRGGRVFAREQRGPDATFMQCVDLYVVFAAAPAPYFRRRRSR